MMKKFLIALGLAAVLAQSAFAWKPTGWAYFSWPYAYDAQTGDWHAFLEIGGKQYVYGYPPALAWAALDGSGLATGWNYTLWPYTYDNESAAWYYIHQNGALWCLNIRSGQWSTYGQGPNDVAGFTENNGVVSMEAEHFSSQNGYGEYANTGASGSSVMRADGGGGSSLDFQFTVQQGGTWYIWIRANANANENNGMYLNLDGAPLKAPAGHSLAGARDIYLVKSGWSWQQQWLIGLTHAGPVTMELTPGQHVLSILKRKMENPLIDKIVLTKTGAPPSGYGPTETPPQN